MPNFYPEGNRSLPSDNEMRSLHKIVDLGGGGSGGGGSGTGDVQVYMDRAPAAPDNPALAAISYASSDQVILQWNGSAWV